jgi:hypothetical protein
MTILDEKEEDLLLDEEWYFNEDNELYYMSLEEYMESVRGGD